MAKKPMTYSILRMIKRKGKKDLTFYVKDKVGKTTFSYATFKTLSAALRKAGHKPGVDYKVTYHVPPVVKPAPVPRPDIAVDMSASAVNHGTNAMHGIVLHSTEGPDYPGLQDVEGTEGYIRRNGLEVQWMVDGDGNILHGAPDSYLVYHCKGVNATHIGIEQIGYAKWTAKEWFSYAVGGKKRKQIQAVAELIAYICDQHDIPIKFGVDRGISRHSDHPEGGHHDPGKGYPLTYVIKQAAKYRAKYRNPA